MELGWIVELDDDTGDIVGVRSVVRHWSSLPWAEQTFYQAKYGFNEKGILYINMSKDKAKAARVGLALRPQPYGAIVVPPEQLSGSNYRLQAILSQTRAEVESYRYDYTALAHLGPDETVILTTELSWGLTSPRDNVRGEIDEKYLCFWENSAETWGLAPWWALGPDAAELFEIPAN